MGCSPVSWAFSVFGGHTLIILYLHNPVKKYYNETMITIHRYAFVRILTVALLGSAISAGCASVPRIEPQRFTERHYSYSVLLVPEKLGDSPQLELGLSLLRMEYPAEQAEAFHDLLYGQPSPDAYKDFVFNEQRKIYREKAGEFPPADGGGTASYNWRHEERYSIKQIHELGIVIERDLETYSGGANASRITQYYNIEIIGTEHKLLTLEDLFGDFQENQQFRDIVYEELRKYDKLDSAQPLSRGIYFNNQPELSFNFFISDDGLGLYWNPAQIAPRTHGNIQIILPWDIVQPLMEYTALEILAKYEVDLSDDEEW
jgi:hypothetical protein